MKGTPPPVFMPAFMHLIAPQYPYSTPQIDLTRQHTRSSQHAGLMSLVPQLPAAAIAFQITNCWGPERNCLLAVTVLLEYT